MGNNKLTIKINNDDKVEQLLQETYNLACQQHKQLQDEINKIATSTVVNKLDIDGKEKYAKIMNNYITAQQKCVAQKFDIAKLLAEIVKFKGNLNDALNNMKGANKPTTLNLTELRKIAQQATTPGSETEEYTLKK